MISVVTITFNNFSELKDTLASLSGVPSIESVVINGGSDSASVDYLTSHSGVVLNEKDEGSSDAFNKGIRLSTGLGVAFLNSGDTLIDSQYYAWAERALVEDSTLGFIYSDLTLVDGGGHELRMAPRGKGIDTLGKGLPFPHPTLVVRREIFQQIGGFSKDYKIAMDFDFVVRLLGAQHRGLYYPHSTVRMDGSGISVANEWRGIEECRRSLFDHSLFTEINRRDFSKRVRNYKIRQVLKKIFGEKALRFLKKLK
jgi:GT2 family glycosyltransferase